MIFVGKERFEYETYAEVYIVLEEDGTEVNLHIHFVKIIEISVFEPIFLTAYQNLTKEIEQKFGNPNFNVNLATKKLDFERESTQ